MSFLVHTTPSAEKEILKLDRAVSPRIVQAMRSLAEEPYPRGVQKLKPPFNGHRIRVGDYRILYDVDTRRKVVAVYAVKHRRDAYR
jgi:mRNA interferase RelE/StbE